MVTHGVAAHTDHFETKSGRLAAELPLENARKQISGEAVFVDCRDLHVELGREERSIEPPLKVGAARTTFDGCVDRDNSVQILALQRSNREARQHNGFHSCGSFFQLSDGVRSPRRRK
jgi:hypothetical protein